MAVVDKGALPYTAGLRRQGRGQRGRWMKKEAQYDEEFGNEEMAFEALFEQSARAEPDPIEPGDTVIGKVLHVGERMAQLDLGYGREGMLDLSSVGPEGKRPEVGDEVKGVAIKVRNRMVEVGYGMPRGALNLAALHDSMATGMAIEGKVTEVNKGGYVIEIGTNQGFCPLGQMDVRRIEDTAALVGQKLMFRVIEMREGRDAVLSRKAVLEAERLAQAEETRKNLAPGARFRGRVTNVRDFGFFVDIGGLEGMVHVSELPHGKRRPQEVVSENDVVDVEVVRVDEATGDRRERIALSMRALADDPFEAAIDELPLGTVVEGTVRRIQPYGAFVEIAGGIEGLLHVSAFGRRVATPADVCKEGDTVLVRVKELDPDLQRVSLVWVEREKLSEILVPDYKPAPNSIGAVVLGMARAPEVTEEKGEAAPTPRREARARPPAPGALLQVVVARHAQFGVFVTWEAQGRFGPGEGLVPLSELGIAFGGEIRRKFPIGMALNAEVVDVRPDGKVRLSKLRGDEAHDRAQAEEWLTEQKPAKATEAQIGSFGALLKEKLGL